MSDPLSMPARSGDVRARTAATPLGLASWCLFDWANSPYPTIVGTFVFSVYFQQAVAANPDVGSEMWTGMVAISGLTIAVLAPIVGAIADRRPRRKPAIAMASAVTILCAGLLWFIEPDPGWALTAVLLVALANIGFEISILFNNAMLKDIAPSTMIGRLSGWGWGLGYFGAITCLMVSLYLFVLPDTPPFGLDKEQSEHVRLLAPLTALWFLLFMLPLMLFTPDRPYDSNQPSLRQAAGDGVKTLWHTLKKGMRERNVLLFLIASMLYRDGMGALFAFGGLFAAQAYDMDTAAVIEFAVLLNISAGLGAVLFAWMDDKVGSRPTILLSLGCLIAAGCVALLAPDAAWFRNAGIALGLFVGPAQAASRTLMARLAPPEDAAEYFGLYAMAGKATSFLAPLVITLLTAAYDLQTAMWAIVGFLSIGLILLIGVKEPGRA